MRHWLSKIAILILTASLTQAGLVACCGNRGAANAPLHACCSPGFQIQASAPQPVASVEPPWASESAPPETAGRAASEPLAAEGQLADGSDAVLWVPGDLYLRAHFFLI